MITSQKFMQTTIRYLRHNGIPVAAIVSPQNHILQVWAAVPGHAQPQLNYTLAHDLVYNRSVVEDCSEDSFLKHCLQHHINPTIPPDNKKALGMIFSLAHEHPDMFIVLPREKAAPQSANQPPQYPAATLRRSL